MYYTKDNFDVFLCFIECNFLNFQYKELSFLTGRRHEGTTARGHDWTTGRLHDWTTGRLDDWTTARLHDGTTARGHDGTTARLEGPFFGFVAYID